jgi:hypothetical protein
MNSSTTRKKYYKLNAKGRGKEMDTLYPHE